MAGYLAVMPYSQSAKSLLLFTLAIAPERMCLPYSATRKSCTFLACALAFGLMSGWMSVGTTGASDVLKFTVTPGANQVEPMTAAARSGTTSVYAVPGARATDNSTMHLSSALTDALTAASFSVTDSDGLRDTGLL